MPILQMRQLSGNENLIEIEYKAKSHALFVRFINHAACKKQKQNVGTSPISSPDRRDGPAAIESDSSVSGIGLESPPPVKSDRFDLDLSIFARNLLIFDTGL